MPITRQITFRDGNVSTYGLEHQSSIPGKDMAFSSITLICHMSQPVLFHLLLRAVGHKNKASQIWNWLLNPI
jgi:hypothetical protein